MFAVFLASLATANPHVPDPLFPAFTEWVALHGREYASQTEMSEKFSAFKQNHKLVTEHNARPGIGYTLELNRFADMTWEEFQATRLGAGQNCSATRTKGAPASRTALPESVDWRTKGVVTPVKDQGHCGSCWTFSTTGCLESQTAIKTGKLVTLSEQNLVDCAGAFNNKGCDGGLPSQAFEYVRYNGGLDTEASYPYKGVDGECKFTKSDIGATVSGVKNITFQDEMELQQAVAEAGPVSIAFQVASDFRFYKNGVYDSKVCKSGPADVNHAVLAVGYDKLDGKDYWIVKNSWNTTWGIQGYFYIKRGENMCGLADCASYPIV